MVYQISHARRAALEKAHGGVVLFFNNHQPPQVRVGTKVQDQPLARVNALRGYHGMLAWTAEKGIRATFNFSPSLIEQLELYSLGGTDIFLEHTKVAANKLTAEQKAFIRDNFFSYNDKEWAIKPWPRYRELLEKKERGEEFTKRDFLDLQVWFNLGMFGHSLREESREVRALIEKGRHYTETDKRRVIEIQMKVIADLLKNYRCLQEQGRGSLSVSPYVHPIIPLLIDQRIALERAPGAWLPQFSHPDDARAQLHLAGVIYERVFGRPPLGMWPSEGAVCREMLPLVRQAVPSIKYLMTDAKVRELSQPGLGADWWGAFQPWQAGGLNIFFRNRQLSDDYGYVVMMRHESTAFEIYQNITRVIEGARGKGLKRPVVPLVLDGDNFQRSRQNDGYEFVDKFYRFLASDPRYLTMLPEEYLALNTEIPLLTRLAPGTWIDDFSTWTGDLHYPKYTYWRVHRAEWLLENLEMALALKAGPRRKAKITSEIYALAAGRNLFAAHNDLSPLARAYLIILQAESSCFRFWFAGKEAEMADLGAFDRQYRQLIADGYRALGLTVPSEVYETLYPERSWAATQPKIK